MSQPNAHSLAIRKVSKQYADAGIKLPHGAAGRMAQGKVMSTCMAFTLKRRLHARRKEVAA